MGLAISTFSIVRGLLGPWNTAAFMESSFLGQEIADENAGSRRGPDGPSVYFHEADRGVVSAAQGLAHDELAADELERLVREEDADIDQSVVLRTGPAPRADRIRRHEGDATSGGGRRQRSRSDTVADSS